MEEINKEMHEINDILYVLLYKENENVVKESKEILSEYHRLRENFKKGLLEIKEKCDALK